MSMIRGTKRSPNSLCKRSASACLRTEPNTRNPFEIRTFVVPQPIPVDTPVTTTSLLFAIAFLLLLFELRVGTWPSVYRPLPVLLAIDRFRLTFPEAREGPITVFYGELECPYPPNTHAAAWLIIIWDALRF